MWKGLMDKMLERKFPIYKFYATWDQDDFENNGTGYSIMYKENPSAEQLDEELQQFKLGILAKHSGVIFKNVGYEFVEDETWCCNWFNHYTYNQFETDSKARQSFRDFVDRKKQLNHKNGHIFNNMNPDSKEPYYCLMGAEDYYRRKLCRCEHCTKLGKITIDH